MTPLYHHRQNANVIVVLFLAAAALIAAIGGVLASPVTLLALPILVLVGWIFSSLTVKIT